MKPTNTTTTMFILLGVTAFSMGCSVSRCSSSAQSRELDLEIVRTPKGSTLYEEYRGERIFTYCTSTNASGSKVVSVYCGERSPDALVHRRIYMSEGIIFRTERITTDNPMLLLLEEYDVQTGTRIEQSHITQGESKQFYRAYSEANVLTEKQVQTNPQGGG